MTPLDQAFIKAYMQQDAALAAPAASRESAQPMPLAVALQNQPPSETAAASPEAPLGVSTDSVQRVDQGAQDAPVDATEGRAVPSSHVATAMAAAGDTEDSVSAPVVSDAQAAAEPYAPPVGITSVAGVFQPMLQVDHYTWPKVCSRLNDTAEQELDGMTDAVAEAIAQGHKVVGIAGCRRGEGATTMLLCAAQRLAQRGHGVVMVDGNLGDPKLGKRLGLLPEFGWEEVLAGRLPLDEVVIESTHNRLAVLPLCGPFAGTGGASEDQSRVIGSLAVLAARYDLVLVDLGPLEDPKAVGGSLARGIGSRLDAVVLVQDVRTTTDTQLAEIRRHLEAADIAQPGIIRNFVSA